MAIITYGKSFKSSGTAKTRRHARRRAVATEREKLESIIDTAFGVHGERRTVEVKRLSRPDKALFWSSIKPQRISKHMPATSNHLPSGIPKSQRTL